MSASNACTGGARRTTTEAIFFISKCFHLQMSLCGELSTCRCILQWELSGAYANEEAREGLEDTAKAMPEEESEGYVLDMRDGSDFDRASDYETAAEERRPPVSATIELASHAI